MDTPITEVPRELTPTDIAAAYAQSDGAIADVACPGCGGPVQ